MLAPVGMSLGCGRKRSTVKKPMWAWGEQANPKQKGFSRLVGFHQHINSAIQEGTGQREHRAFSRWAEGLFRPTLKVKYILVRLAHKTSRSATWARPITLLNTKPFRFGPADVMYSAKKKKASARVCFLTTGPALRPLVIFVTNTN